MIKEAYCSFEVAKLLKEKGFKESTQFVWYEHLPSPNAVHDSEIGKPKRDYFYWEKEGERNSLWTNNSPVPSYISGEVYSCPTHQMTLAWLREIYNIFIIVKPYSNTSCYFSLWQDDNYYENLLKKNFPSYEETVEAALKYTLKKLI